MKPSEFLRTLAPDFCWVSAWDLFLMYEQICEDYPEHVFKIIVHREYKAGNFDRKIMTHKECGDRTVYLYKRKEKQ